MRRKISEYEIHQVEEFIMDLKEAYAIKLRREDYIGEAWIAYLEMRRKYSYAIPNSFYWDKVETCVLQHLTEVIKKKNAGFNQYNTCSLNKVQKNFKEEMGVRCPSERGDFVNWIALWDYVECLGTIKYAIVRLLFRGEEDGYIIKTLHLDEARYFKLKRELQQDFIAYANN